jgi:transposase
LQVHPADGRISTARNWCSIAVPAVCSRSSNASSPMLAIGAEDGAAIAKTGTWKLEIVKRNELHRFVILPKHWIVERTLAWISHHRRLARDFERYARSVAAFVRHAMIRIMLRRLARPSHCS